VWGMLHRPLDIVAPSGMPEGKPAGARCAHLSERNLCSIYDKSERPGVCDRFQPSFELCGSSGPEALERIALLEELTKASFLDDAPESRC
jgi:Fe-S-cluster containining protein